MPATPSTPVTASAPIVWRLAGNGGLGDRLLAEWCRLRRSAMAVAHVRALGVTRSTFEDLDGLLRLAGFGVPSTPATDAVLAALVRRAGRDDLVARIVLQRILPGLLTIARAERRDGSADDVLDEIVAEAWVAIRCYSPDRPSTAIAARLLSDTRHRAFTGPRRRRCLTIEQRDVEHVATPHEAATGEHPFVELTALLLGARAAGLGDQALATVRVLVAHDSVDDAAAAAGVTPRALRYRRQALVEQLRALEFDAGPDGLRWHDAPTGLAMAI